MSDQGKSGCAPACASRSDQRAYNGMIETPVCTHFRNPNQLCHAVKEITDLSFDRLTPRPWNLYDPDATLWWLIPSGEWPAHKYTKLGFGRRCLEFSVGLGAPE
jgi:hypothetical protein